MNERISNHCAIAYHFECFTIDSVAKWAQTESFFILLAVNEQHDDLLDVDQQFLPFGFIQHLSESVILMVGSNRKPIIMNKKNNFIDSPESFRQFRRQEIIVSMT